MSKENTRFTKEQEAAITHRGGSLLVSAAAGSGKTMVLVERLLGYIEQQHNIDEFLIITYTRSAACELRERIYEKIRERLADDPGNMHLRRQLSLCRGADIDTIHTFCSLILRENSHLIELPADFKIADESECEEIRDAVLEDVFSRTYNNIGDENGLPELIEMYNEGRDDRNLVNIVKEIYKKLISLPNYEQWIDDQIKKLDCTGITDISQTEHGKYLMNSLRRKAEHCIRKIIGITEAMSTEEKFKDAYGDNIYALLSSFQALSKALENSWDKAVELAQFDVPKVKSIKGYDELKAVRTWCLEEMKKIGKNLDTSSRDHINDMRLMKPITEALFSIVLDFDKAFKEEKRKRGILDFSDLEHLTLSLLYDKSSQKKNAIAESISKRFTEIMIDEYQDVNEVQEKLFNLLSKDEKNIFMVGDVKQSIYRFRLAEPAIFLRKYKAYEDYKEPSEYDKSPEKPVKINLSMNFRSHKDVLEAVNCVFRKIMSEEFGELTYSDAEELRAGRQEKQGKKGKPYIDEIHENTYEGEDIDPRVEIDLLSVPEASSDEEENPVAAQIEAEYVAKKIKEMLDKGYQIAGKSGEMKKIEPSDIAILSRAVKNKTWRYASELSKLGIKSDCSGYDDYFEASEVQTILNLMKVIDNPMQDIPLASVLSSPIFDLNSDEMVKIRASQKYETFYDALKHTAEHETGSVETTDNAKNIIKRIEQYRELSLEMPTDRFLWHVYNETGILKRVISMKNGAQRRKNLIALAEFAQRYEASGFKGLFSFLNHIQNLQERGADISQDTGTSSATVMTDAVKILSVHKSKGLEFPIVFLVDTGKKHNTLDLIKPLVFHKDFGIGIQIADKKRRIRYNTLARIAVSDKQKGELLSEELRVLYVAMTRAREKLIITGIFGNASEQYEKIKMMAESTGEYTPNALMSMTSIADWIIAGTMGADNNIVSINIIGNKETEDETEKEQSAADRTSPEIKAKAKTNQSSNEQDTLLYEEDNNILEFEYPYPEAVKLPSKLTVTGIKALQDKEAESASWAKQDNNYGGINKSNIKKPRFIEAKETLSGVEKGILMHEILRYIDYDKCSTDCETRNTLESLVLSGHLNEKARSLQASDIDKIVRLFKSELGKRLLNAVSVTREFKYSLLSLPSKYFKNGGDDDQILIQGVIDCYFEENGKYIVIDFKTDRVNDKNIKQRIEQYTPQLNEYGEAIERITKKEVSEKIIYFLETGTAVSV